MNPVCSSSHQFVPTHHSMPQPSNVEQNVQLIAQLCLSDQEPMPSASLKEVSANIASKPPIQDELILNLLSKSVFDNYQNFLTLISFYESHAQQINCQPIVDKICEQIDQLQDSKQVLWYAQAYYPKLKIERYLTIEHAGQKLQLLSYYERILKLDFSFFNDVIFGHENPNVWTKDKLGNTYVYLNPPSSIESERFIPILSRYLQWLYNKAEKVHAEFILLQDYFGANPNVLDASEGFFKALWKKELKDCNLNQLAKDSGLFPCYVQNRLFLYLLATALEDKNNADINCALKDCFEQIQPIIELNLFCSRYDDIDFLTPFFSKVKHLTLQHNSDPQKAISLLKKDFSHLKGLSFNSNQIQDQHVREIIQNYPNLTHIDLSGCWQITDQTIQRLTEVLPNLTSLNLEGCLTITDAAIERLAKQYPHLKEIDLADCHKITRKAIENLAKSCCNLTSINLNNCCKFPNTAVEALARNCPNLMRIDLSHTYVEEKEIDLLIEKCPDLKEIVLFFCSNIWKEHKSIWSQKFPHIKFY